MTQKKQRPRPTAKKDETAQKKLDERIETLRAEIMAEAGKHVRANAWAVQAWAMAQDIGKAQKHVLLALAVHADEHGYLWLKSKTLAEECGCKRRNVWDHIRALKLAGLIARVERSGERNETIANGYYLPFWRPPMQSTAQGPMQSTAHPPVQFCAQGLCSGVHTVNSPDNYPKENYPPENSHSFSSPPSNVGSEGERRLREEKREKSEGASPQLHSGRTEDQKPKTSAPNPQNIPEAPMQSTAQGVPAPEFAGNETEFWKPEHDAVPTNFGPNPFKVKVAA